nr:hypothetical protein [Tanacetum cinerariifolium]
MLINIDTDVVLEVLVAYVRDVIKIVFTASAIDKVMVFGFLGYQGATKSRQGLLLWKLIKAVIKKQLTCIGTSSETGVYFKYTISADIKRKVYAAKDDTKLINAAWT